MNTETNLPHRSGLKSAALYGRPDCAVYHRTYKGNGGHASRNRLPKP